MKAPPTRSKSPHETFRQRYIRLLTLVGDSDTPLAFDESVELADRQALGELEHEAFITGHRAENMHRQVRGLFIARITVKGRRLLDEFKKEEALSTSWGFVRAHRFAFYKWIFGISAALWAGYLLRFVTEK